MAKKAKGSPKGLARGLSGTDVVLGLDGGAGSSSGSSGLGGASTFSSFSFSLMAATNTITGTAGNDANLSGTDQADLIRGLSGNDNLFGYDNDDTLFGGGNTDRLYGGSQNDWLLGENGTDTLFGGDGDDTLRGGSANDSLYGGNGQDTLDYTDSPGSVSVDLAGGTARDGFSGTDVFSGVEHVAGSSNADRIYGDNQSNSLFGNGGSDSIYGDNGNDFVRGGSGNDSLYGGSGQDTLDYSDSPGNVTVDMRNGSARDGFGNTDEVNSFETLVGGAFNDTMWAPGPSTWLIGGAGNDTLYGNTSNDTIDGGEGNDVVFGDSGDDYFFGSPGADTFHDPHDNDVIDYSASPEAIAVVMVNDFTSGGGLSGNEINGYGYGGWAEGDTFIGLHPQNAIIGSDYNDTIIGYDVDHSPYANTFLGGAGDDTLMPGGDGPNNNAPDNSSPDSMFGGDGSDWVSWQLENLNVTVDLAAKTGRHGGDLIVLSSIEHVAGSRQNDSLYGDAGDNSMRGLSGNDSIYGGAGGDALYGDDNNDSLYGGSGADRMFGGNATDSVYGGSGADTQYGGAGDDRVVGATGADTQYGDDGNDSLFGDSGADQMFGGSGNDFLRFDQLDTEIHGGAGTDTAMGQDVKDVVQLDTERFNGTNGFAAIEYFYLGGGDDNFNGSSNAADFNLLTTKGITLFGGSGRDSISMRGLNATSGIDDYIDAGSAYDQIWGGFGNDTIYGNHGDDFIYGGKGNDTLYGGQGFDVFYVGNDEGTDWIHDNAAETNGLVLFWGWDSTFGGNYDGLDPSEVTITYSGNDVRINMVNGGEVHFQRTYNSGTGTWDSTVDVLNLWDYGQGDAGNSPTTPSTYQRDVWASTFDPTTGQFTAFTLAVNG